MPDTNPSARVVLTTVANRDEANRLARTLVDEQLAACITMLPGAESIYRWQGHVETANETLLMMKTGLEQLPALEARLRALHSYQTPEFLVLKVESGTPEYLEWLQSNLKIQ